MKTSPHRSFLFPLSLAVALGATLGLVSSSEAAVPRDTVAPSCGVSPYDCYDDCRHDGGGMLGCAAKCFLNM